MCGVWSVGCGVCIGAGMCVHAAVFPQEPVLGGDCMGGMCPPPQSSPLSWAVNWVMVVTGPGPGWAHPREDPPPGTQGSDPRAVPGLLHEATLLRGPGETEQESAGQVAPHACPGALRGGESAPGTPAPGWGAEDSACRLPLVHSAASKCHGPAQRPFLFQNHPACFQKILIRVPKSLRWACG